MTESRRPRYRPFNEDGIERSRLVKKLLIYIRRHINVVVHIVFDYSGNLYGFGCGTCLARLEGHGVTHGNTESLGELFGYDNTGIIHNIGVLPSRDERLT